MRAGRNNQSGFSLVELLVVVFIIGMMSLITIPQFVSYQQSAKLKTGMSAFNGDLRSVRQLAITHYWQVRIEFPTTTTYTFYYRSGTSGSWNTLTQQSLMSARINGVVGNTKTLPKPLTFVTGPFTVGGTSYPAFTDLNSNSLPDVIFNTDGSATIDSAGAQSNGSIEISSPWKNVTFNQMIVTVYTSGKVTSVGAHS